MAKFGVGCTGELVLELSATGRLYQGVQPARGVVLGQVLSSTGSGSGHESVSKQPRSVNVTDGAADVAHLTEVQSRFSAGAVHFQA